MALGGSCAAFGPLYSLSLILRFLTCSNHASSALPRASLTEPDFHGQSIQPLRRLVAWALVEGDPVANGGVS